MRRKKDLLKQWKVDLQAVQEEKRLPQSKNFISPQLSMRIQFIFLFLGRLFFLS
ncbi:hypothetical protein [Bacillus sp. NPDC057893]|uniref:hypothetical protein n=1 Tax=Bacillus sp. NPDC057893 TaxID=3346273 RepID=UPI003672845B